MEEIIKIIILGIVEGITEFLPISSTGHLLVFSSILNSEVAARLGGTFEIFIQIGAVFAVIAFYWSDLWVQIRTVTQDRRVQRLWLNVVIASLPAGIMGLLLRDFIKDTIFTDSVAPWVVAIMLIIGGIIFLIVERRPNQPEPTTLDIQDMTMRQSLWVGLAQTLALVPGVSRSGASIIGGMLTGLNRQTATAFSFYLAIPVLGGATVLDLMLSLDEITSEDLMYLLIGALVSGIIAWIAIRWLLHYVATNNFIAFGYYRIIAGISILLLLIVGLI
jgi:undecaprenyl-diphosphatase